MGRKLLLAAVCLLVVGAAGAADRRWIAFSDQVTEASIGVLSSARDAVELEIELPGVALESVATEGGRFVRVEVPGLSRIGAVGEPALPALRRFIEIPDGARVEVDVQVLDRRVIDLAAEGMAAPVEPVQLPRPKCDCKEAREWRFSYSPETYRGTIAHPTALTGPFTFRDHRMMLLTVAPVSYDVERGTLSVATRAQVTVRFEGGDLAATVARKERLASRHFDAFLGSATVNLNLGLESANWAYPDRRAGRVPDHHPAAVRGRARALRGVEDELRLPRLDRHYRRHRHHDHRHQELHHRPLQRRRRRRSTS